MAIQRIKPGPNQESVWDYPRPPRLERVSERVRVELGGVELANTTRAFRVLETSHPPTYYLPPGDVRMDLLRPSSRATYCEWKGRAQYWTAKVDGRLVAEAAWSYPDPTSRFSELKDHLAFYCSKMDACYVGDEEAWAQEGDFYGGWITSRIVGPFKGAAGTWGW